eukprot:1140933-Pelagomonas_calceolata.AAC.10
MLLPDPVIRFALEEKAKKQITIESDCSPPGARVSASFVAHSTPVSSCSETRVFLSNAPYSNSAVSCVPPHLRATAAQRVSSTKINVRESSLGLKSGLPVLLMLCNRALPSC